MKADNLDATFFALASELGRHAVMKHLATLERGGQLVTAKDGRDKRLWFDPTPLQLIHERWTTEFSACWASRLTRLKYSAEGAEVLTLPQRSPSSGRRTRKHA